MAYQFTWVYWVAERCSQVFPWLAMILWTQLKQLRALLGRDEHKLDHIETKQKDT